VAKIETVDAIAGMTAKPVPKQGLERQPASPRAGPLIKHLAISKGYEIKFSITAG